MANCYAIIEKDFFKSNDEYVIESEDFMVIGFSEDYGKAVEVARERALSDSKEFDMPVKFEHDYAERHRYSIAIENEKKSMKSVYVVRPCNKF